MTLLLTLFRIVINWARKCLVKIIRKLLKDILNALSDDIARKVVAKLLRQEKCYYKNGYHTKKIKKIKQSSSHY